MIYSIAERFRSIQGEGVYAGTPMAFIRFVGCSVGKKICQHCDTIFEKQLPWQGGGQFDERDLRLWIDNYRHVCLTGGEPFDQELQPLLEHIGWPRLVHVETSGTKPVPEYIVETRKCAHAGNQEHFWICVSPKPGFLEDVVMAADEVKVIVPGLGEEKSLQHLREATKAREVTITHRGPEPGHDLALRENFRWPDLSDALRWADAGKIVFLQPRNGVTEVDKHNLMIVQDIIRDHPNLRLSVQMHKILRVQ